MLSAIYSFLPLFFSTRTKILIAAVLLLLSAPYSHSALAQTALTQTSPAQAAPPRIKEETPLSFEMQVKRETRLFTQKYNWLPGEALAWSCIARGLEADVYNGQCYKPRRWPRGRARPEVFTNDLCSTRTRLSSGMTLQGPRLHHDFDNRPSLFRHIRSEFLTQVLSEPELVSRVKPIGVRIIGGIYCQRISLENISTDINLVLDRSFFYRRVSFQNFRSSKNISIENANILETINMRRSVIEGSIFLSKSTIGGLESADLEVKNSFNANQSIFFLWLTLNRARIGGNLGLVKTKISHVIMRNAAIGANADLQDAEIRCSASLVSNDVKGDLIMDGTTFGRRRGAHHIWLLDGPNRNAREWYSRPSPTRYFINKTMVERGETVAYREGGKWKRRRWHYSDCRNRNGKPIHGYVRLNEQKVSGTLCLRNVYGHKIVPPLLSAGAAPTQRRKGEKPQNELEDERGEIVPFSVSLNGVQAQGPLVFTWLEKDKYGRTMRDGAASKWQIIGVEARSIYTTLDSWPDHYEFHNVTYPNLLHGKANCDLRPENTDDELRSPDEEEIIYWLSGNQKNSAQTYRQMIKNFESVGRDPTAIKVSLSELELNLLRKAVPELTAIRSEIKKKLERLEKRSERRSAQKSDQIPANKTQAQTQTQSAQKTAPSPALPSARFQANIYAEAYLNYIWAWMKYGILWTYGLLIDFGHRPLKIFGWIVACIGAFWFTLSVTERRNVYRIKAGTSGTTSLRPGLFYAIDMFIPFIQIREGHYQFELKNRLARGALYIYRLIGYLFSAFLLAGISGLTS